MRPYVVFGIIFIVLNSLIVLYGYIAIKNNERAEKNRDNESLDYPWF